MDKNVYYDPIEENTKQFYGSAQNRLTFNSMTNSTTFKVCLFRGPLDTHHHNK